MPKCQFQKKSKKGEKILEFDKMKGTPGKPIYLATNLPYRPLSHSQPFLLKNQLLCLHPPKSQSPKNQFPPGNQPKMKIPKQKKLLFWRIPLGSHKWYKTHPDCQRKAGRGPINFLFFIPIGGFHGMENHLKMRKKS